MGLQSAGAASLIPASFLEKKIFLRLICSAGAAGQTYPREKSYGIEHHFLILFKQNQL
jgi:hypothetical protein